MDENQKKENVEENINQEPEKINENNMEEQIVESEAKEQEESENGTEEAIIELKKKKGSYITGTIGAIIGGFIGAIPWVLTYTFANMIVAILAILIVGGAFLGYKICKGKIGRALPAILTIISLLVVTVVTTVICPTILMARSNYPITLQNLLYLYSDVRAEVREAIIQDLVISLAFTIIGIAAIVRSISVQIKQGVKGDKLKFNTEAIREELRKQLNEQSEVVKKVCVSLNSMNKENTVEKQDILNELEMIHSLEHKKAKQYFATCVSYKLLKKHKGKYYYDETDEQAKIEKAVSGNSKKGSPLKTTIIIIVALIIGIAAGYISSNMGDYYTVPNTNIKLKIDYKNQEFFGTAEEITEAFGEEAAGYNDFILMDKATKYEIFGEVVKKEYYGDEYDLSSIIQATRDYYNQVMGEGIVSEVEEKKLSGDILKRFKYDYEGNQGEEYTAITYLYEAKDSYLWIFVYTDRDYDVTKVDTVIDELLK